MSFTKALEFLKQSEKHSIFRIDLPGLITMRNGQLVYLDLDMKTHLLSWGVRSWDKLACDWQIAVTVD